MADGHWVGRMHCCWGRCSGSFSGACTEAPCDFRPGSMWACNFLHSQLGPIPGFKMVAIPEESPIRRKLRNSESSLLQDQFCAMNLRLLMYTVILTKGYIQICESWLGLPLSDAWGSAPLDIDCKRISATSYISISVNSFRIHSLQYAVRWA